MIKRIQQTLFILGILSCITVAQEVELSDYIVPVSRAVTVRFNGNWNFSQTGDSVLSNNAGGSLLYKRFYSSQPLAWFITVDATGGKNFNNYNHNFKSVGRFRKYVWDEKDWFGDATLTMQHTNSFKQVASDFVVGFGYGRYINATPLAKAVRIEDHLLRDGVLYGNMPKENMIAIANIIQKEDEYKALYSSVYENAWLRDIEYEIQKSDSVKDENIGSLGVLRMRQVLFGINERVNERYYGWDVTMGFLFRMTTFDKSQVGAPSLSLRSQYSVPLGWSSQFNWTADVSTPMDSGFAKEAQGHVAADFIFELSNRINLVSGYRLTALNKINTSINLIHNLDFSFWYYVENNVYLTINSNYVKEKGKPRQFTSNVGLQYNFY
ncbi:MAG: hypothetical protein HYV28_05985 [Ignavibacteriales bacterium]|nr:hypothetical protein [Ignavibacteriales bacterium]